MTGGLLNQGGGKIEYVDPSKIIAGQKYKTGLVFIYPATSSAIDDVDALFTGWIVFNNNVNRWQEAGREALKGNWDASSGTLPSTNVIAGNKYIISVAGVVNSVPLKENDTIIAKIDNPTDSQTNKIFDDWTVFGAITTTSNNVSRPNGDSVETGLVDLETGLVDLETNKVDKVVGKQLSEEDYTTTEKNKLAGIADGAEVNVQSDYNQTDNTQDDYIKNKPTLGTIASKNVGNQIGEVQENGAILGNSQIVETDANGKFITVAKNAAYNKNFGTANGDVARGDASYLKADTYTQSEANSLLNAKENTANKGQANGYASLDGSAKVPASQLPSYVDDVEEYANLASFPTTGETGKIYVALDTSLTYRWSGSTYVSLNDVDLTNYFNKTADDLDDINAGTTNKHFTATLETKLNGIEENATADQTDAEIKTAYENNANTNAFTDTEKTKLAGIEDLAQVNIQSDLAATTGDAFILNKSTQYISDSFDKRYVTESEKTLLSNTSGTNTGDETTLSVQIKRPLKTIEGQSLEGAGNIDLTKADVGLNNVDNTSDANKPVSTPAINALKANSAVFVNSLTGDDNNDGLSLFTPFETVGKGLTEVTNSGNVNILGSNTQSINHTFASSQFSIKVSISDAFKISGTLNLVNGNTSIEFYNGKTNLTINDDSAGTFYMNNVNVGGATLNFSRSGYKVIRGSTSAPTVINLTGSGGTLLLENVSGGVIPINIGAGWTVYVVNSLLGIGTNNGIVIDRSTTLTSVITNQTTLNTITSTTNNTLDGLHLINFGSPTITGLTVKKGDIIYKVGQFHFLVYTFESAPDVVSKALSATTREVYYKNVDEWISIESKLAKASNLSDVANQQNAINNITNVASATNEYVLTKDTSTGNAIFKPIPSLQALLPTGSIVMSIATSLTGALKFDGVSAYSKSIYSNLYAILNSIIGTAYDVDANNFYLPDPSGRVLGVAGGGRTLFSFIGSDTHTLSISEIPSHTHNLKLRRDEGSQAGTGYVPDEAFARAFGRNTSNNNQDAGTLLTDRDPNTISNVTESAGSSQAHSIVQKTAYISKNMFIYY